MKKLFAIILTFAMLFTMAPLSALNTAADTDGDEDGKINIRDVAAIQRYLANFGTLTLAQLMAADTDGDGSVTVDDATWLQMYLAEYDVVLGKQS